MSADGSELPPGPEFARAVAQLFVPPGAPPRPDDTRLIEDLEFVSAAEGGFAQLSRDELLELLSAMGRVTSHLGAQRLDLIAVLHGRRAVSAPRGPGPEVAEEAPKQPAAG